MICAAEKIEVDGFTWYWQQFNEEDGTVEAVNLYDADGDFVCEFSDYNEMMHFLKDCTLIS